MGINYENDQCMYIQVYKSLDIIYINELFGKKVDIKLNSKPLVN